MDAPVPLILARAARRRRARRARPARARAPAMLGALVLAPVDPRLPHLRLRPGPAAARPPVAGGRRARSAAVVVAGGAGACSFDRRPAWLPVAAVGDAAVPRADRLGRLDGEPARAALPRGRRRRAGLRGAAAAPAASAPSAAARPGALEWALAALPGALRAPVRATPTTSTTRWRTSSSSTSRSRCCSRCSRASRGRRALARVCLGVLVVLALALVGDRLRRVRDAPPVPEPEGHRLQPARGLLPRQLAVLRPEHLRALPGDRDARCSSAWLLWARAPARRRRRRAACSRCCGAGWC